MSRHQSAGGSWVVGSGGGVLQREHICNIQECELAALVTEWFCQAGVLED